MHLVTCLLVGVLPFAFPVGATGTPNGSCTPGSKVAKYDDLPALPINDANIGPSAFNPYLDLNYTRFSVAEGAYNSNKFILYVLSQLSAGPVVDILRALAALLGPLGSLPALLTQPSIVGSTKKTMFRLEKFDFLCGVRNQGASNVVPAAAIGFPCYIVIRPIEPEKKHMSFNCSYTGGPGFETCHVDLPPGQGFDFLTFSNVSATGLAQLQDKVALACILNPLVEFILASLFDNVKYTEYCSD